MNIYIFLIRNLHMNIWKSDCILIWLIFIKIIFFICEMNTAACGEAGTFIYVCVCVYIYISA